MWGGGGDDDFSLILFDVPLHMNALLLISLHWAIVATSYVVCEIEKVYWCKEDSI